MIFPKPLGDNTAVPFRRAGDVLYPHPFSFLARTHTHTPHLIYMLCSVNLYHPVCNVALFSLVLLADSLCSFVFVLVLLVGSTFTSTRFVFLS